LALKSVLAADDSIDTLVFDEIDVGLGGRVALAVGEKLRQLARKHQVICITHLASIACMADQHLLISKHSSADATFTQVRPLTEQERIPEIARLLDGETSAIAYQHAKQLLDQVQKS
jgi:DNA repair protein RecN (Recombination protein N)